MNAAKIFFSVKRFVLLIALLTCAQFVLAADVWLPKKFQIFQRVANGPGAKGYGSVEVQLRNLNTQIGQSVRAKVIPYTSQADKCDETSGSRSPVVTSNAHLVGQNELNFLIDIVPTGGWYCLAIDIGTSQKLYVDYIAVGEVFIAAGQSNSTQLGKRPSDSELTALWGAVATVPASGATYGFRGPRGYEGNFVLPTWHFGIDVDQSADPTQPYQPESRYSTPWLYLAKQLVGLNVPLSIISVGCGSTSTDMWFKDASANFLPWEAEDYCGQNNKGSLYNGLLHAAQSVSGRFRAILWHQGESDALRPNTQDQHYGNMKRIITTLNQDLGISAKWFVANASYYPRSQKNYGQGDVLNGGTMVVDASGNLVDPGDCTLTGAPYPNSPNMLAIRLAQQQLVNEGLVMAGPDTDGLIGAAFRYPEGIGGCAHMSSAGLEAHGRLWYAAIAKANLIQGLPVPVPATRKIYRHIKNGGFPADVVISDSSIPPSGYSPNGTGSGGVGPVFSIYAQIPAGYDSTLFNALYRCKLIYETDTVTHALRTVHFTSSKSDCEGKISDGASPLGFVWKNPAVGSRPLYRFYSPTGYYYVTTSSINEILGVPTTLPNTPFAMNYLHGYAPE
jgi:Carbohydrate esterase, sialic acid-specific acetylesterase